MRCWKFHIWCKFWGKIETLSIPTGRSTKLTGNSTPKLPMGKSRGKVRAHVPKAQGLKRCASQKVSEGYEKTNRQTDRQTNKLSMNYGKILSEIYLLKVRPTTIPNNIIIQRTNWLSSFFNSSSSLCSVAMTFFSSTAR